MLESFLITLREGIEASLLVSIIISYLDRTGNSDKKYTTWMGVLAGILFSALAGGGIIVALDGLTKNQARIFEGTATLLACSIMTWMIIWMHRNAAGLASGIRNQINITIAGNSLFALGLLSFFAIAREGVETLLFLYAASVNSSIVQVTSGAVLGLVTAIVLGITFHIGTYKLNLKAFFKVSGTLLIFFAAGLLAYGIHELQSASVLPTIIKEVWNINHILHDKTFPGNFLKAAFGYNGNPSLIETVSYVGYILPTLYFFSRPTSSR